MTDEELDTRIEERRAQCRASDLDADTDALLGRLFAIRTYRIEVARGRMIALDHGVEGECWPTGVHPSREAA